MRFIRKLFLRLFLLLAILIITVIVLNVTSSAPLGYKGENNFRKDDDYPFVVPFYGAELPGPRNTFLLFETLIDKKGAPIIEIDLQLTKDDVLIDHLGSKLLLPNSGLHEQNINEYTYEQIRNAYFFDDFTISRNYEDDLGNKPYENLNKNVLEDLEVLNKLLPARINEDLFSQYGDDLLYVFKIFDENSYGYSSPFTSYVKKVIDNLIELVEEYKLEENVLIFSFSEEEMKYINEKAPDIMVNTGLNDIVKFTIYSTFFVDFFWKAKSPVLIIPADTNDMLITGDTAELLGKLPQFILKNIGAKKDEGIKPNLINKRLIKKAHRKNIAVFYIGVEDKEQMKLLIEYGADGIITDHPEVLQQLIDELKAGE